MLAVGEQAVDPLGPRLEAVDHAAEGVEELGQVGEQVEADDALEDRERDRGAAPGDLRRQPGRLHEDLQRAAFDELGEAFGRRRLGERAGLEQERADAEQRDDADDAGERRDPARQHRALEEGPAQRDRRLATGLHLDLEWATPVRAEGERVVDLDADAELDPRVRRDDGAGGLDRELEAPVRVLGRDADVGRRVAPVDDDDLVPADARAAGGRGDDVGRDRRERRDRDASLLDRRTGGIGGGANTDPERVDARARRARARRRERDGDAALDAREQRQRRGIDVRPPGRRTDDVDVEAVDDRARVADLDRDRGLAARIDRRVVAGEGGDSVTGAVYGRGRGR